MNDSDTRIPPLNTKVHILLLDDESQVTRSLVSALHAGDCVLHQANTPHDALTISQEYHLDVAIADHNLQDTQTGLDVLSIIHNANPYCFRIIFSGEADLDFAMNAINTGHIDGFLEKPWDDQHLRVLVRQGAQTAWLRQHNALLTADAEQRNEQLKTFNHQLEEQVYERTRELIETNHELLRTQQNNIHLETQATISQLVSGLAHELNNPLAAMLGYAQRFQRKYLNDSELQRCFTIIRDEGERCKELLNRLNNFTMNEHEHEQTINILRILKDAGNTLRDKYKKRALTIHQNCETPNIRIGEMAFRNCCEHILANAIEAQAQTIHISCEQQNDRLYLFIDNDGIPIDEKIAPSAAKPFVTKHKSGHHGLGLSLVASALRPFQTTVSIEPLPCNENNPENTTTGTRCTLILPGNCIVNRSANVQTPSNPIYDGEHILILDDEPMIAEILSSLCEDIDIKHTILTTFTEAQNWLTEHSCSGIISDATLDDGTVSLFAHHISSYYPSIMQHFMIVSGNIQTASIQDLVNEHKCLAISKPFRMQEIKRILESWHA